MSQLSDHLDRIADNGGSLLEFEMPAPLEDLDLEGTTGFALAAVDHNGHTMVVEMSISRDGNGITAVVATYDPDGSGRYPSVHSAGYQTMVTVDGDPNAC